MTHILPPAALTLPLLAALFLVTAPSPAGEPAAEEVPGDPPGTVVELPESRLDRAHDWLYLKMQDWATRLDRRFVRDGEEVLPTPPTPFRIELETEVIDRDGGVDVDAQLDVDLLLELPNLEKRLKIFITSNDLGESPDLNRNDDRRVRAGVRLRPWDYLDFDVGVRADVPPIAFTSLRWQRQYEAGAWDLQPFAKVYLETEDGLGAAAGFTADRWMNRLLLRSSTYANWIRDEDATKWTQSVLFAHAREILRFGRYGSIVRGQDLVRAVGVQALVSGERTSRVDTYELSVFAKMPTGRNWLYWHVTPLVRWEREYGWSADPGIRVGIDVLFWSLSDR
jgi:hypothetical protein